MRRRLIIINKLIRKSPKVIDPLVLLREKTRRRIDNEISMSSTSQLKLWRGKSISALGNNEYKSDQYDNSITYDNSESVNMNVNLSI